MKRALLAAILLLALPAVAQAKGLNGITLCGASGCVERKLDGLGDRSLIEESDTGLAAPSPSSFYRLMFGVAPYVDPSNAIDYEPKSGLVALDWGVSRWTRWERLHPAIASVVKELTRKLEPFPRPTVTEVRIGKRVLREDAASYLRLHRLRGTYVLGGGRPVGIRFVSPAESPWTDDGVLYYPENDVLLMSPTTSFRVPADLAADIEAARPLGTGGGRGFPWAILAGGIALTGTVAFLVRRRRRAVLVTTVLAALVLAGPGAAKPRAVALEICGAAGCTPAQPPDLGHQPPLRVLIHVPPARPAPYHTAKVTFDFGEPLRVYYVSAANAFAALHGGEWRHWYAGDGPLGEAVRKAAEVTRPFPAPQLSATERALLELSRTARMPLTGRSITLRLRDEGPWEDAVLGYFYPAADVLCRPYSTCVRVPAPLAAELEGAPSSRNRIHWAIALPAGAAVLAAMLAAFRPRREGEGALR